MFKTFEHKADIGVRGKGGTVEKAFEECALAMTSVMAKVGAIEPKKSHVVNVKATDYGALLIAFLSELLFLKDKKQMLYSKFRVTIKKTGAGEFELKAVCFGEKIDAKKHSLMTEVKAATYSELKVEQEGNMWIAQCIVDV